MNKIKRFLKTGLMLLATVAIPVSAAIQPLEVRVKTPVGSVSSGRITLPVITWGADIRTIYANGNQKKTSKGSIFGQLGLDFAIQRQDVFADQVKAYRSGKTPYLRGTMGMINMALQAVSDDPRIKPIVIYQLSWSAGGDALVVKEGIKQVSDLRGKTIAIQKDGPHVDYLGKVLNDASLTFNDVNIVWKNDLTATDNTPVAAFYDKSVDATMVIIPDGLALTSGGNTGTGAEGSVKGAKILLSTKTANRIISDVYAVRADYLAASPDKVQAFVHGLMKAQEAVAGVFSNQSQDKNTYNEMIRASAQILLDTPEAVADTEGMYLDAEHTDYTANVKFFSDAHYPRSMVRLTSEIQTALSPLGLTSGRGQLTHAQLDYQALKQGLAHVVASESAKFDAGKVASVVAKKQQQGTLDDDELFSFEVFFKPNQKVFSGDLYNADFDKVIEYAFTYGGALITVEGHSDPMRYLKLKKKGKSPVVLRQTRQSAKNLSLSRAMAVRKAIIDHASSKQVPLDESQFAVVGHGIDAPKSGTCGSDPCAPQNEQQWRDNMRVQFRIIQVEAEADVFQPL